jgi:hypothetical protein
MATATALNERDTVMRGFDKALAGARKKTLALTLRALARNPRLARTMLQVMTAVGRGEKVPRGISVLDLERQVPSARERIHARTLRAKASACLASSAPRKQRPAT